MSPPPPPPPAPPGAAAAAAAGAGPPRPGAAFQTHPTHPPPLPQPPTCKSGLSSLRWARLAAAWPSCSKSLPHGAETCPKKQKNKPKDQEIPTKKSPTGDGASGSCCSGPPALNMANPAQVETSPPCAPMASVGSSAPGNATKFGGKRKKYIKTNQKATKKTNQTNKRLTPQEHPRATAMPCGTRFPGEAVLGGIPPCFTTRSGSPLPTPHVSRLHRPCQSSDWRTCGHLHHASKGQRSNLLPAPKEN